MHAPADAGSGDVDADTVVVETTGGATVTRVVLEVELLVGVLAVVFGPHEASTRLRSNPPTETKADDSALLIPCQDSAPTDVSNDEWSSSYRLALWE